MKRGRKGKLNSTSMEVAERRRRIEKDYISGLVSGQELAIRYGVSASTISNDLKAIFEKWREAIEERTEELRKPIDRTHAILALTEVYRLSGEGFRRSQQNKQEIKTEYRRVKCEDCKGTGWEGGEESSGEWCNTCDGDGERMIELVTTKETGQAGDPAFLRVGVDAIREVARLRALYPERPDARQGRVISLNLYETKIDINAADPDDILTAKMILAKLGQRQGVKSIIEERGES